MSYQRWTEGDAYVIGTDSATGRATFWCVGCDVPHHESYRLILNHLRSHHHDSKPAIERLEREAEIAGLDNSWDALPKDLIDGEHQHVS